MSKKNLIVAFILALGVIITADAQNIFKKKKVIPKTVEAAPPSKPPLGPNDPKPYGEVITKEAKTSHSFFDIHKVKDRYYFEIPDSIMGRDILIVNRVSKAPVSYNKQAVGYPGDQIGENVIQFDKGPNNKIYMRNISYLEQAKDTLGMYQSVKNSNIQPIVATFDVKALKKDSAATNQSNFVIDFTDFINSDNNILFFDSRLKTSRGIGGNFGDRGYIDTIKAFPINIEIKTVKTYSQMPPQGIPPQMAMYYPNDPLTYELNSSLILLDKEPMKPRLFDPRVAYFAVRYTDFDSNPQGIEYKSMATRWRLEPKDEDLEKYKNGELVEPKKPIVFYIDPATPKKWVPYLMQGVNDWELAFRKAGFKNAIYALEAPNDSTWSLEDARHSAIVYKPSDIPNASGPHVHDPRSGEILETHINWYHNVMKLLRNWYMIQAAPNDPRARAMQIDDDLMGQLIRFVSSHEVGHTLGLRHNFGSSSTVPVEKLRDKAWVEANGHTPSIMDYARFNYVAQPEDKISDKGIFPRIGIYDEWSIEWGYRYLPQFATAEEEVSYSNKTIIEKLTSDKRYTFGTETDGDDPRNQSEDLGDNAMLASSYGIKNLQRIVPNILEWTKEPNKDYANASEIYGEVTTQYARYMGHVTTNVAGIYRTPVTIEQIGNTTEFVPATIQKEAVAFLNAQLFSTPTWLINSELINKANIDPVATIGRIQKRTLDRLISSYTLDKIAQNETYNGASAYTANNLFNDLKKGIWTELSNGKPIDIYRRNLQKIYVANLINVSKPNTNSIDMVMSMMMGMPGGSVSDAASIARGQLVELRQSIKTASISALGIKKYHLQDLLAQIDTALDTRK